MIDSGCHPELLIDEYNDIKTTNADSFEKFREDQEERKAKYMPQLIKEWRSIK